ncbi:MAG: porin, partial [Luteolibacter sp.]
IAKAAALACLSTTIAHAGQESPSSASPAPFNACEWLQNKPGLVYKNDENPWIQSLQFEGRLQYQAAYLEGEDVNGNDFNETFDEYRRARLGTKVKFLGYFGAKYQVNLVEDGRRSGADLDWQYQDIDEAYLSFDLGKALELDAWDELTASYGRHKFTLGHESTTSSTKLLTVERSALSNKVYGSYRPTGLKVDAVTGDWEFGGAIYSSSLDGADHETFGSWNDSEIYWLHSAYAMNDQLTLGADFAYNNADRSAGEDSVMDYQWASSLNAQYTSGRFGLIADVIFGDNGSNLGHNANREGSFYGLILMPHYWLLEDKLEAVAQYQWMGSSESEGVRINSRYGRSGHGAAVNSGRGDQHHSLYSGLNYYLCGHQAKIQAGIEYQTMDTPNGDFDTLSYVLAFRTYF